MLYTKKGDNGTTKLFSCPQGVRLSKADYVFEVLGTCDELNAALGYAKTLARKSGTTLYFDSTHVACSLILESLQHHLFVLQAELAGADKHLCSKHIDYLEHIIYEVETIIPPLHSFVICGGSETSAYLDVTRTLARKLERHVVTLSTAHAFPICKESLVYTNRLSSVLYALARYTLYKDGYKEQSPRYA